MATARPGAGGRPPGWPHAHARRYIAIWPAYDEYQKRTTRETPLVTIERV
jgi:hypothetical protein